MPGIIAGALLVFIPATGELVIPSLVGRADSPMIGRVINDEFFLNRDWPMASAVAVALLVLLVVPIMIYNHLAGAQPKAEARNGQALDLPPHLRSSSALPSSTSRSCR